MFKLLIVGISATASRMPSTSRRRVQEATLSLVSHVQPLVRPLVLLNHDQNMVVCAYEILGEASEQAAASIAAAGDSKAARTATIVPPQTAVHIAQLHLTDARIK